MKVVDVVDQVLQRGEELMALKRRDEVDIVTQIWLFMWDTWVDLNFTFIQRQDKDDSGETGFSRFCPTNGEEGK